MNKETSIKLFEQKQIRSLWNEEEEKWYFSIADVIGVLTDSPNPNNYWKVLKHRLTKEGSELITNCNQLKMQSGDGKFYKTDVADTEQLFRLIQSIPSPKAETCGIETARILIKELGGITVSIPMVNSLRSLIERYIKENIKEIPIKKIARELGMNERAVGNILKKIKNS